MRSAVLPRSMLRTLRVRSPPRARGDRSRAPRSVIPTRADPRIGEQLIGAIPPTVDVDAIPSQALGLDQCDGSAAVAEPCASGLSAGPESTTTGLNVVMSSGDVVVAGVAPRERACRERQRPDDRMPGFPPVLCVVSPLGLAAPDVAAGCAHTERSRDAACLAAITPGRRVRDRPQVWTVVPLHGLLCRSNHSSSVQLSRARRR